MIKRETRILAVDFAPGGFGFAVLGPRRGLIDWGFACVWAKDPREFTARIEAMIERLTPSAIVLQAIPTEARRAGTAAKILSVLEYSRVRRLPAVQVSSRTIRRVLRRETKQEIMTLLIELFPELADKMPPPRKRWMSETRNGSIFDAVAMVLAATSGMRPEVDV